MESEVVRGLLMGAMGILFELLELGADKPVDSDVEEQNRDEDNISRYPGQAESIPERTNG